MTDAPQLGDLPNLNLLFHPDLQGNYVNKLRELARQHGQEMFLKNITERRHNLQSSMEDAHSVPDSGDLSAESQLLTPSATSPAFPREKSTLIKKIDDNMDDAEAVPLSILLHQDSEEPPHKGKLTDFSIKSLSSSKYSSDDETLNRSLIASKQTDNESLQADNESLQEDEEDMNISTDSSLKAINSSQFNFLHPSTSNEIGASLSSVSIPSANSSPYPSPGPSPNASFTTLPQMPMAVTHIGRKPLNGPPCSLKTLVDDNVLDPLDGSLTYEIMGSKFVGDLLANGFIRMSGTSHVFANPSSWANFCRSTIASCSKDGKNYGSAWSIIRYLGKRLDSYKLRWYRKQKKQFTGNGSPSMYSGASNGKRSGNLDMFDFSSFNPGGTNIAQSGGQGGRGGHEMKNLFGFMNRERLWKLDKVSTGDAELNEENLNDQVLDFASIDLEKKDDLLDENTRISAVPFNSVLCIQPFIATVSTNVLLLVDFHSHLSSCEVNGYLGGTWDPRTQHLTICQAYPLWFDEVDTKESQIVKIKQSLRQKGLILVGWYHSHPNSTPQPSVGDIKKQLQYQKKMLTGLKGLTEYSPCVGLISAPYYPKTSKLATLFQMFWVMPIFTHNCRDFGRPMQISYSISRDAFLTQDLLVEMRLLATHLNTREEFIQFNSQFREDLTYWDKLYESIKRKLPCDLMEPNSQAMQADIQQQALMHFWTFLRSLLHVVQVD